MKKKLPEILADLSSDVSVAASDAPDEYPDYLVEICGSMEETYSDNKETLLSDWSEARALLKRDVDKVALIDAKLKEAFDAFDAGNRDTGRRIMREIHELDLRNLR